jgi:hypothetical protein
MKPITRYQIFAKEKKKGETNYYIDFDAKISFTPLFFSICCQCKVCESNFVNLLFHEPSQVCFLFTLFLFPHISSSSSFLATLFLQPWLCEQHHLKKKSHKNIVENVKGFRFATSAKGKKVGGCM